MINENFEVALNIIYEVLNKTKIKWALIGSTNMQLQGMSVSPHDLDIVVQLKNLEDVQKLFLKYKPSAIKELKPLTNEPGWEIKVEIEKVEVQILGEKDTGEYVSKLLDCRLIEIPLNNMNIPCFTLKAEAQTYAETKREHKAQLIQEFLKQK